jgi:hypothetical protein
MKNLAGDSAHRDTVAELFHALKQWQKTVSDTLVLDPAHFGIRLK